MSRTKSASSPLTNDQQTAARKKRSAQMFWKRYFAFYDTLNEARPYRDMIERHAELLQPAANELILDAGTGTGNVAVELLAKEARVIGIDFCEPALEKCRQKAPQAEFRFADLSQPLEFDSNSFDKIACCAVLHVLDRETQEFAIREFFRVLKPGGALAVTAFRTGFNSMKVYVAALKERRKTSGLADTALFAARYSISTARILYYVWRIKKREKSGDYNFLTRDELTGMLSKAGLELLKFEMVFADQCISALARKPI